MGLPEPPETLLDATVRDAIADSPYFHTWAGFRALWAWVKHHIHPSPSPTPTDHPVWNDPLVLDQGNYGTCVGNGWAGWLVSDPVMDPGVNETLARAIYYESTIIGGSPDDPDAPGGGEQGSTVRDGAKAVQNRGRLAAYAFTMTTAGMIEWLQNHGPVVMGTDWTNDMFSPDGSGLIHATGPIAGGHCYLCVDYDPVSDRFEFVNSWGAGWGRAGHFFMSSSDVGRLLSEQGEACCAAELPL